MSTLVVEKHPDTVAINAVDDGSVRPSRVPDAASGALPEGLR